MSKKNIKKDKRSITSKANMRKAQAIKAETQRAEKIAVLQSKQTGAIKAESDSSSSSESESSDSENEIVISTKRRKPITSKTRSKPRSKVKDSSEENPMRKELDQLKEMIQQLSIKKEKPERKPRKKVIQIVNPPQQQQPQQIQQPQPIFIQQPYQAPQQIKTIESGAEKSLRDQILLKFN